jgi:hypothetical protein
MWRTVLMTFALLLSTAGKGVRSLYAYEQDTVWFSDFGAKASVRQLNGRFGKTNEWMAVHVAVRRVA